MHGGAARLGACARGQPSLPGCRLVAVSLVDAHLCADPGKYLAALLLSLATMLHLELPQVSSLPVTCKNVCSVSRHKVFHFAKVHLLHRATA